MQLVIKVLDSVTFPNGPRGHQQLIQRVSAYSYLCFYQSMLTNNYGQTSPESTVASHHMLVC